VGVRSIVMKLDHLTREQVLEFNIPTGKPIINRFNDNGSMKSKEEL
jgi:bisphosphoglycerate-dependent phosphoglycerate mutase